MNSRSNATIASETAAYYPYKKEAATVSLEDDESSSSFSSEQPNASTAGLFIATNKPLPLSTQRTVPLPKFWSSKRSKSSPPDFLGKGSSNHMIHFSSHATHQPDVVVSEDPDMDQEFDYYETEFSSVRRRSWLPATLRRRLEVRRSSAS